MNAPFAPDHFEEDVTISLADMHDEEQARRIAHFVQDNAASPFHLPEWLIAVERGTGQQACGLVARRAGRIVGWLPLTMVHSPLFGRALVSSGFAVDGGILASEPGVARHLARAAAELAQRQSCAEVELRGGETPAGWDEITGKHFGFVSDLAVDDEAQLLAIPRKQRAEVRKSLKGDFTVTVGTKEADRAAHYACYAASVRNLGTPVFPRALFDAMLRGFDDRADILTVWEGEAPLASVLTFYHDGAAYPFWGGGVWRARETRANERMYYALMCHARAEKNCTRFDFGRSKAASGPYHYKKNWGFEPQPLAYSRWTAPGEEARDVDPTSDAFSRKIEAWKKLPLPVANRIGPIIARGLA
ncbi:FemAB family XrtA/PEP-CTERM system-associated protein [Alteriqipengyuania lutimaris]|uniref:FemAB family PEP-CTERM system-associated protein n=1 Tax=Alteriqipengyuania lutimaris TaxID=1538146 RepID=A0A395LMA8_9SPHN|nr:FemAB family XrtA/PEP-CTERM system-associated protein [Alteriqipengyuania lutimaris]MBB3032758.1 FemAB-related protein (PEP-CTERM system-associated) [Alteriqipengyuania lutimaris]RDS78138.1 FemAB family PEP-CTERM system-associated protein [Alteriqipengyuania lutimaris]